MSKKLKLADKPDKKTTKLRKIARQFSEYLNEQYKENIAYIPDTSKRAAIKVSQWLELPDVLSKSLNLPGLPFGQITQIYGKKDTGKSSFLMQAIAACQLQGILPILILTEHKFDFERLKTFMDADPEELLVLEPDDLETGFSYMEKLLRDIRAGKIVVGDEVIEIGDQKCFIFWDSIGGTVSASEADGETTDWNKDMGRSAQAIKRLVKRSTSLLKKVKNQVGILLLNQVWGKRSFTGIVTDQPYGGESVLHYYALEIHLKRGTEIKMTHKGQEMGIGYNIKFEVKKNHVNHNKPKTQLAVVAEGLIGKDELEDFKKNYKKFLNNEK